ncbi:MAG: DUF3786 domain-containing protein [Syntrophales bacterium]|nr:DUF3786 domain-containing protein [Syntrophales bacterium]
MPRTDDFLNAINLAREKLLFRDPDEICRNAAAELLLQNDKKRIVFPYFLRKVEVAYPGGIVAFSEGENNLPLQEQGLILHYLLGACDMPLTGELITFRELPSGEFYYEPFLKRAQVPLVKTFGLNHELFRRAGEKLGGKGAALGDISMTFRPFPQIPVTLLLWRGDEEFPPDGNILFDASIKNILHVEDIAFLAGTVVYKLMALSRN